MIFSKWKVIGCVSSFLLSLAILVACNNSKEVLIPESNLEESGSALFDGDDLDQTKEATITEVIDLEVKELDNKEVNIESLESEESVAEKNSDLATQAVLPMVSGHEVYYRVKTDLSQYQIWSYDQANDVRTSIYSSSYEVQSVAVNGDGNIVVASIKDASGFFDVYIFNIGGFSFTSNIL